MDPLFWSRASGNPSGTAALSDTESSGVGVFTRAAPVCAAQIGVNLRQSTGSAAWSRRWLHCYSKRRKQSGDFIYFGEISASIFGQERTW